jgi:prepilin-type N-terminal cleavage/methylation domain-containing protein
MKNMLIKNKIGNSPVKSRKNESGFSLIEMIIALAILLIAVLGIFATFTFATIYNSGNNRRSQALSLIQRESELLRSYKFTPTVTDPKLTGGTKTPQNVTLDGFTYQVKIKVDDDPFTPGIQIDNTKNLKEITLEVIPQNVRENWVVAVPTTVIIRRVRAN